MQASAATMHALTSPQVRLLGRLACIAGAAWVANKMVSPLIGKCEQSIKFNLSQAETPEWFKQQENKKATLQAKRNNPMLENAPLESIDVVEERGTLMAQLESSENNADILSKLKAMDEQKFARLQQVTKDNQESLQDQIRMQNDLIQKAQERTQTANTANKQSSRNIRYLQAIPFFVAGVTAIGLHVASR